MKEVDSFKGLSSAKEIKEKQEMRNQLVSGTDFANTFNFMTKDKMMSMKA